jgi:bacterioferritin
MSFVSNIEEVRARARKHIEDGPVTQDYGVDRERAIAVLNEALATEIMCVLRYRFHYFMASGIHSGAVKEEFLEHSREEQEHADRIAERIKQLGGRPEMHPQTVAKVSHSEYTEGVSLVDMIKEDLVAERIAIETYREMARFFGDGDPTSRVMMEEILAKEEEHADELADLLFAVQPQGGEGERKLYFADEVKAAQEGAANEPQGPRTGSSAR